MQKITLISLIVSILFLSFIIQQVRKKNLSEAYSLLWIATAVIMILITAWPKLLGWTAKIIGIYYTPAALFLVIIFFILIILLQYSILITKKSNQIKKITQELALFKNEYEQLKNKHK